MKDYEFIRELNDAEKDILGAKFGTAIAKAKFANQLKQGLGGEMKSDPRAIKLIKKPWTTRLKLWLTKIFTKF
jgi:hypothetical protein